MAATSNRLSLLKSLTAINDELLELPVGTLICFEKIPLIIPKSILEVLPSKLAATASKYLSLLKSPALRKLVPLPRPIENDVCTAKIPLPEPSSTPTLFFL